MPVNFAQYRAAVREWIGRHKNAYGVVDVGAAKINVNHAALADGPAVGTPSQPSALPPSPAVQPEAYHALQWAATSNDGDSSGNVPEMMATHR